MDQSSHEWLKTLESACEHVLAEPSDRITAPEREDMEKLLVQVRAKLNGEAKRRAERLALGRAPAT